MDVVRVLKGMGVMRLVIWAVILAVLSWIFGEGQGLAVTSYLAKGDYFLIKELGGTSANDNSMIEAGFYIFLLNVIVLLALILAKKETAALVFSVVCLGLQLFCLLLIETESLLNIFYSSIFKGGNLILLFWVAALIVYISDAAIMAKSMCLARSGRG